MLRTPRWAVRLVESSKPKIWHAIFATHGPMVASFAGLALLIFVAGLGAAWASDYIPEAVGICFTVAVIDFMLEQREKRRAYPARYAAYLEANFICNRAAHLWFEMVRAASAAAPPVGDNLLGSTYVETVSNLDLNAPISDDKSQVWAHRVSESAGDISTRIEKLIQRYQATLDGNLLTSLRRLENSVLISIAPGFPMMFNAGKQVGARYTAFQPAVTETFVMALSRLGKSVQNLSKEFRFEADFRPPCDLSFRSGLERLHLKDDIAPKIGSGRFEKQSWQPPFANFQIGDGPPPP